MVIGFGGPGLSFVIVVDVVSTIIIIPPLTIKSRIAVDTTMAEEPGRLSVLPSLIRFVGGLLVAVGGLVVVVFLVEAVFGRTMGSRARMVGCDPNRV